MMTIDEQQACYDKETALSLNSVTLRGTRLYKCDAEYRRRADAVIKAVEALCAHSCRLLELGDGPGMRSDGG